MNQPSECENSDCKNQEFSVSYKLLTTVIFKKVAEMKYSIYGESLKMYNNNSISQIINVLVALIFYSTLFVLNQ
jgi:hypothetical protein